MGKSKIHSCSKSQIAKIIALSLLGATLLGIVIVTTFVIFMKEAFTLYIDGKPQIDWTWISLNYAFVICGTGFPTLIVYLLSKRIGRICSK